MEKIKDKIENKYIALATITPNNKPHCIAAEVNKVDKNKIIITDNFMKTTVNNIKNNPYVSLVLIDGENGWRINGKAEYKTKGEWFDYVKNADENKGYNPKGVLIINITEVKVLS